MNFLVFYPFSSFLSHLAPHRSGCLQLTDMSYLCPIFSLGFKTLEISDVRFNFFSPFFFQVLLITFLFTPLQSTVNAVAPRKWLRGTYKLTSFHQVFKKNKNLLSNSSQSLRIINIEPYLWFSCKWILRFDSLGMFSKSVARSYEKQNLCT